ncbi:MAG: hypothetical protein QOJ92_1261 [Frankiales bacterium]|nr:hypothetical protein [Frankiales bacterium]
MNRYRSGSLRAAVLLLACSLVGACGGGSAPKSDASKPTPTPSPSYTLPTLAADKAAVKLAIVTAADLGSPWIQPKKINQTKGSKGKSELCPGHLSASVVVPPRATADAQLTEGSKAGATIGSFVVSAYAPDRIDAWRTAHNDVEAHCLHWKAAEGNYDVITPVNDVTVPGADEVLARIERVYADAKSTQLQYVRQVVAARVGRVVCNLQRAYLTTKADPTGKDFTETVRLVEIQLKKAVAAVAQ